MCDFKPSSTQNLKFTNFWSFLLVKKITIFNSMICNINIVRKYLGLKIDLFQCVLCTVYMGKEGEGVRGGGIEKTGPDMCHVHSAGYVLFTSQMSSSVSGPRRKRLTHTHNPTKKGGEGGGGRNKSYTREFNTKPIHITHYLFIALQIQGVQMR